MITAWGSIPHAGVNEMLVRLAAFLEGLPVLQGWCLRQPRDPQQYIPSGKYRADRGVFRESLTFGGGARLISRAVADASRIPTSRAARPGHGLMSSFRRRTGYGPNEIYTQGGQVRIFLIVVYRRSVFI